MSCGITAVYGQLMLVSQLIPHYDFIATPLVIAAVLTVLDSLGDTLKQVAVVSFFLLLEAIMLFHQWDVGVSGRHALLGGILPWSDAADYFSGALRRIHGLPYTLHSTKRPIYPLLLALVLRLAQEDLRLTLLTFATLAAVVSGLATHAVLRDCGRLAATVVACVLIFYLRRYLFVVGTEAGGFLCGTIAFLFFWNTIQAYPGPLDGRSVPGFAAGILFLTLGLLARAGPMFVLPALLFFVYRESAPRIRPRLLWTIVLVIVVAVGINMLIAKTTGEGATFSDYPAIFYGLIHGRYFSYIVTAHPELTAVAPGDRAWRILNISLGELMECPWLLPLGMVRSIFEFLIGPQGLFSLVFYTTDDHYFEQQGTLVERLLAAITAGVIVSSAFTPPWITEGGQLQASTVCFLASFAVVVFADERKTYRRPNVPPILPHPSPLLCGSVSAASLLVLLIAWLIPRAWPILPPPWTCKDNKVERFYLPSTRVDIVDAGKHGFTLARFAENLGFLSRHNPVLSEPLAERITAGTSVEMAYNSCAGHVDGILAPRSVLKEIGANWSDRPAISLGEPDRSTASGAGVFELENKASP